MQTFSALPASYRFHIYILGMCEEADSINATMVNSMAPVLAALGSSTEVRQTPKLITNEFSHILLPVTNFPTLPPPLYTSITNHT